MTDNPNVKALDPSRRYLRPVAPCRCPAWRT